MALSAITTAKQTREKRRKKKKAGPVRGVHTSISTIDRGGNEA